MSQHPPRSQFTTTPSMAFRLPKLPLTQQDCGEIPGISAARDQAMLSRMTLPIRGVVKLIAAYLLDHARKGR